MEVSRRTIIAGAAAVPLASLLPSVAQATERRGSGGFVEISDSLEIRRLGPVITPDMLPTTDGVNIAGPSAIFDGRRVRLYFADHKGTYIRLAYATNVLGPYKVYEPGTLSLDTVTAEAARIVVAKPPTYPYAHIASPDVHRLKDGRWRMYFHAAPNDPYINWNHQNGVAHSRDGVTWHLENKRALQDSYLRGFQYDGQWFGINREGVLLQSYDGVHWDSEAVPEFAAAVNEEARYIRHVAVVRDRDVLSVYYSRIGDAPERIMLATVKLEGPWQTWRLSDGIEILRPEFDWEGADLPLLPSQVGSAVEPGNELRDPGIFDHGGRRYLYYAFRGERGIGLAEIRARKHH